MFRGSLEITVDCKRLFGWSALAEQGCAILQIVCCSCLLPNIQFGCSFRLRERHCLHQYQPGRASVLARSHHKSRSNRSHSHHKSCTDADCGKPELRDGWNTGIDDYAQRVEFSALFHGDVERNGSHDVLYRFGDAHSICEYCRSADPRKCDGNRFQSSAWRRHLRRTHIPDQSTGEPNSYADFDHSEFCDSRNTGITNRGERVEFLVFFHRNVERYGSHDILYRFGDAHSICEYCRSADRWKRDGNRFQSSAWRRHLRRTHIPDQSTGEPNSYADFDHSEFCDSRNTGITNRGERVELSSYFHSDVERNGSHDGL